MVADRARDDRAHARRAAAARSRSASSSACCSSPRAPAGCGWSAAGEARAPQPRGSSSRPKALKRGLGSPALFGIVQGFIAASIYFALGLVAERALGLTLARLPRRRRASSRCSCPPTSRAPRCTRSAAARRSSPATRSTSWSSFIAGWAILLDYLILDRAQRVRDHGLRWRCSGTPLRRGRRRSSCSAPRSIARRGAG